MNKNLKEEILDRTANGLDLFQILIGSCYAEGRIVEGKSISNPLLSRAQNTPSFNVYRNSNSLWLFKDFADADCFGNVFEFYKRFRNYSPSVPFSVLLRDIATELGIAFESDDNRGTEKYLHRYVVNERAFTAAELAYWSEYGIDLETLSKFGVKALAGFQVQKPGRTSLNILSTSSNPIFAFDTCSGLKLYQPLNTKRKFKWLHLGPAPSHDFIFGLAQVPKDCDTLILAAGQKDVLSLHARGFNAVCLNSESAILDERKYYNLHTICKQLVVCYDNDDAGVKASAKIAEQYDLCQVRIPIDQGKDVADYFKSGNSAGDFRQLVSNAQLEYEALRILNCDLDSLPAFPAYIYESLPLPLKQLLSEVDDDRKRDALLLACLPVISHTLPNLITRNRSGKNFCGLYVGIVGTFSSGKGIIVNARRLCDPIQRRLYMQSKEDRKLWRAKQKSGDNDDASECPPLRSCIITGDTSAKAMIEILELNGSKVLIFDTELDTLTSTQKQPWGDINTMLRKAFHSELISTNRAQTTESSSSTLIVEEPVINLVLSGTPKQMTTFLGTGGLENGLYSRFLTYVLLSSDQWIPNAPTAATSRLESEVDSFSALLQDHYFALIQRKDLEIVLDTSQHKYIDEVFGTLFEIWGREISNMKPLIPRASLMAQRVACLLTALDEASRSSLLSALMLKCNPAYLMIACEIVKTCLMHSVWFSLHNIVEPETKQGLKDRAIALHLNKISVRAIAQEIGRPPSTVHSWIKEYTATRS